MVRFLVTLLTTGAAVLAASAWWGGREAASVWPPVAEPNRADASHEPQAEGERELQSAVMARSVEPAARSEPAPHGDSAPRIEPAPPGASAVRGAAPDSTALASAPMQHVPSIPSPLPASVAAHAPIPARIGGRRVVPEPTLPEPIPTPFAAPPADAEVEESRIPEPAPFTDEVFALARTEGAERYGEENVVWVEGDHGDGGSLDELFADVRSEPFAGEPPAEPVSEARDERALAMSGHDASAARIRRLLDVYESLGRWR